MVVVLGIQEDLQDPEEDTNQYEWENATIENNRNFVERKHE